MTQLWKGRMEEEARPGEEESCEASARNVAKYEKWRVGAQQAAVGRE